MSSKHEKFELSSRQARFQAELQTRVKWLTEGWTEYADDLRELAERGFPDMADCAREQLAVQDYFRQLNHPQVSFSVQQKRPATLDESVGSNNRDGNLLAAKDSGLSDGTQTLF